MQIPIRDKLAAFQTTIFTRVGGLSRKHKAVDMISGFPDFPMSQQLKDLHNHFVQRDFNNYAPMAGLPMLNEQIALKTKSLYNKSVSPEKEITTTVGATQAIFTAIQSFIEKSDEVIIIDPAYPCYCPCVELNGGIPVIYECLAPDFSIDWDRFRSLVTEKTRMIIVNTPTNPTGKTFKPADWSALSEIVKETNILLLCDEAYESILFDGQKHQSILLYPELWHRTLAIYSLGKTFHCTGWRVGYIIAPEYLMKLFRKVHEQTAFCPGTPAQAAFAEMMKTPESYLEVAAFYQEKRNLMREILNNTSFDLLPCEGTYFQMASYRNISKAHDIDFVTQLILEKGIGIMPVSAFYTSGRDDRILRFCFARKESTMNRAGEVLQEL